MSHPFIDIYAITDERSSDAINQFLKDFNNIEEIRFSDWTEVMIYKSPDREETEWVEVENLKNAFELGVNNTNLCFTILIGGSKEHIEWTTITFTFDNKLVLGLSIREFQDENGTVDNWQLAEELKKSLLAKYNSKLAVIGLAANFPFSEADMFKLKEIWKN